MQELTDAPRLPLAGNELLIVGKSDQPSLAAERAHLSHVIDIQQRIAVNSPKAGAFQAFLENLKVLRGQVSPFCGDDPNQVAFGLERKNLIGAQ